MAKDNIFGVKGIQDALLKFEKRDLKKVIKRAMTRTVAEFRKPARRKTPKDTGRLRKSITSNAKLKTEWHVLKGAVFASRKKPKIGHHGILVERGTSNRVVQNFRGKEGVAVKVGSTKAQPFMKPAFDQNKSKGIKIFRREIGRAIRHVKAKNLGK